MRVILFVVVVLLGSFIQAEVCASDFSVRDFGATGDGRTDDGPAIQKAIDAAIHAGPGNAVHVPKGRYLLGDNSGKQSTQLLIQNALHLTLDGEAGATLVTASSSNDIFRIFNSSDVRIRTLDIDRTPLLFTQGRIVSIDQHEKSAVIAIDPMYDELDRPDLLPEKALRNMLLVYVDPAAETFDHDASCEYYKPGDSSVCWPPMIVGKAKVSERTWKIQLNAAPRQTYIGKPFVVWSSGAYPSRLFYLNHNSNVLIDSVRYFGEGGGTAVTITHCFGDVTFNRFFVGVPPQSNRRLAAAGGFMIFNNRMNFTISNSSITSVWDDAFNMGANFSRIYKQISPSLIEVDGSREEFRVGDDLGVWDWGTKAERERTKIKTVTCQRVETDTSCRLELTEPIRPVTPGYAPTAHTGNEKEKIDRVIDLNDVGTAKIQDSEFQSIHARALLIKAPNSVITGNRIHDTPMGGILAGPEFFWDEGPALENLLISNNIFENVSGTNIFVASHDSEASFDNRNITVTGNKFVDYGRYGSGVQGVPGVPIVLRNIHGGSMANNSFSSKFSNKRPTSLVDTSKDVLGGDAPQSK